MFAKRLKFLLLAAFLSVHPLQAQEAPQNLRPFISGLWPDAQKRGVSRATFDNAMRGITPDEEVLRLT